MPPSVVAQAPSAIAAGSATLHATVNPNGLEVRECSFEYGTSETLGDSAACVTEPGSGHAAVPVSASIAGLSPDTAYYARLSAVNAAGTTHGALVRFTTAAAIPTLTTEGSSEVTSTSARLEGSVNPNGGAVAECWFEYGTSTAYESSKAYESTVRCSSSPGTGVTPVAVSAIAGGLTAGTTYHYRIAASNAAEATETGADETLKTLAGAPTATTDAASLISESTATLNATVSPNGAALTACRFEYGLAEAPGLESSVPCASIPASQEGEARVSASVTALAADATYRYRVLAASTGGTSFSEAESFTTLARSTSEKPPLVTPLPGPGEAESPPSHASTRGGRAELASTNLATSPAGVISIALRCSAGRTPCRGRITLQLSSSAPQVSGRPAASVTLASGAFAIAAGRTLLLKLHLTPAARERLARAHQLRAHATLTTTPAGAAPESSRTTVTIHASSEKHGAHRR